MLNKTKSITPDKMHECGFTVNQIIARQYWQERNLQKYLKEGALTVKIAILGFESLGQTLLEYALMNNVYSLNQSIQYHVWGENCQYRNQLGGVDKMNGDTITYHDADWQDELTLLKEFDRIIITHEINKNPLQELLSLNSDAEIDCYNPNGADLSMGYKGDKLTEYGVLAEILTDDLLKSDKLYREAKKVNYCFVVKYDSSGTYTWERPDLEEAMEEQWGYLDDFLKGSNVACADYHHIRLLVMETMGMDKEALSEDEMEALAEMEHIRWSRYHYVNHWSYGPFEAMPLRPDGTRMVKDTVRRLHTQLIPYAELTEEVKEKDKIAIREMFGER